MHNGNIPYKLLSTVSWVSSGPQFLDDFFQSDVRTSREDPNILDSKCEDPDLH